MKKATLIATQLVLGAAVILLIGCSSSSPTAADGDTYNETYNARFTPSSLAEERVTVSGTIASIDYDERYVTLERSSRVIVVTEEAKLIGNIGVNREEIRFVDLRVGLTAVFSGTYKDKRILAADFVQVSDGIKAAPAGTNLARFTPSSTADDRQGRTDAIASIDYEQRLITLSKSSLVVVVDENAKIVGTAGDSPRDLRFLDLREGLTARFEGTMKDNRILAADFVEVVGNIEKTLASNRSQ